LRPVVEVGLPSLASGPWSPSWGKRSTHEANALIDLAQRMSVPEAWELRFRPDAAKSGGSAARFAAYRGAASLGAYQQLHAAYSKTMPRGARKVSWRADLVNDLARGLVDAPPVALVHRAGGGLHRARLALQGVMTAVTAYGSAVVRRAFAPSPSTPRPPTPRPVVAEPDDAPRLDTVNMADWPVICASMDLVEALADA